MLELWKREGNAAPSTQLNLLGGARQVVVGSGWVLRGAPAHTFRVGSGSGSAWREGRSPA